MSKIGTTNPNNKPLYTQANYNENLTNAILKPLLYEYLAPTKEPVKTLYISRNNDIKSVNYNKPKKK